MTDVVVVAGDVAENVLYPNAIAVDTGRRALRENLDVLAAQGFYGLAAPVEVGGLGVDFAQACTVLERLAGGCLASTLTLAQHLGTTLLVAGRGTAQLREHWIADLCSGAVRSGVAFTGAIPGPPKLSARRTESGFVLNGSAPWVSGWGMITVLNVAARDESDDIQWLLVDAVEQPSLLVRRNEMIAANASNTVTLEFTAHQVPADRAIATVSLPEHAQGEPPAKRINGALTLGVAARCVRLLDDPAWSAALDECRAELDEMADIDAARARAGHFAIQAAAAALAKAGSSSVLSTSHPQRLLREAGLLLVFGSRPAIQSALLRRFSPDHP